MTEEEQAIIGLYHPYQGTYSEFHDFNRFQNLDGIEWKIINHLISSETKHASNFWKLLEYDDADALNKSELEALTGDEEQDKVSLLLRRYKLVSVENDEQKINEEDDNKDKTDKKRVFMQPFVNDAVSEQCSSVYIYVDEVTPMDATRAKIVVAIEVIVDSTTSVIKADTQDEETLNKNDLDKQGNIVVIRKNRATVLLKSILAELNGLYLDGIGYLQLDQKTAKESKASLSLWNSRSFYGYSIKFGMVLSGVSGSPEDSL